MLRLVVGLDPRRKRILVATGAEEGVGQGDGDEAGEGEDEEGEKLALLGGGREALVSHEGAVSGVASLLPARHTSSLNSS